MSGTIKLWKMLIKTDTILKYKLGNIGEATQHFVCSEYWQIFTYLLVREVNNTIRLQEKNYFLRYFVPLRKVIVWRFFLIIY